LAHLLLSKQQAFKASKGFDLHRLRTSELPCSSVTGNRNNNPPQSDRTPSIFFLENPWQGGVFSSV
jgi:hypothetical protein